MAAGAASSTKYVTAGAFPSNKYRNRIMCSLTSAPKQCARLAEMYSTRHYPPKNRSVLRSECLEVEKQPRKTRPRIAVLLLGYKPPAFFTIRYLVQSARPTTLAMWPNEVTEWVPPVESEAMGNGTKTIPFIVHRRLVARQQTNQPAMIEPLSLSVP